MRELLKRLTAEQLWALIVLIETDKEGVAGVKPTLPLIREQ